MSRILKSLLVTLVAGALVFGAVFGAAAVLPISGVDTIGATNDDLAIPTAVTDVTFGLDDDDFTMVVDVVITFEEDLPASSDVFVELIHILSGEISDGQTHLEAPTSTVIVHVDAVKARDIERINITVIENLP